MIKKLVALMIAGVCFANCSYALEEVYVKDCKVEHKSIKYYKKKVEENVLDVCSYYNLSKKYFRKNKPQEALDNLYNITLINPKDEEVYGYRAMIYYLYGNNGNYYREYAQAVKNIPDFVTGHERLSYAYQNILFDYENSLKHINIAIKQTKEPYSYHYYRRGSIYEDMGKYDEAIKDYTRAIELNVLDDIAFSSRSRCYEKIGKTEEAAFDKAMEKKIQKYNKENDKKTVFNKIDSKLFSIKSKLIYNQILF